MSGLAELVAQAIASGHLRAITIELPTPAAAAEQLAIYASQAVHPVTVHELRHVASESDEWWQGGATVQAGPRLMLVTVVTTPLPLPMAVVA